MNLKSEAQKHLSTMSMIWFGLFSSQFIYLYVAHIIKPATTNDESSRIMLFMMGLMALTSLSAGLFFYKFALKAYGDVAQTIRRQRDGRRNTDSENLQPNTITNEPTSRQLQNPALGKAFVKYIISLALAESVAIFGLVVAMTTGEAKLSYPFFGVSIIVMLAVSPFIKIKPMFNNSIQRLNKSY